MNKKIVIIGDSYINGGIVEKVLKSNGMSNYEIELYLDYKKLKKLNFEKFEHNDNYVGILCGPIPHSVNHKGYATSIVNFMEIHGGYPPIIRLSANGALKITNNSLKHGIEELKNKLSYCSMAA